MYQGQRRMRTPLFMLALLLLGLTPTLRTRAAVERNAFSTIQAESYDSMSGVGVYAGGDGSPDVGAIDGGDWISFAIVNFGAGASQVSYRLAAPLGGASIEARLDSQSGPLLGSCAVPTTGSWQAYTSKTCAVGGASGTRALYLRFSVPSGGAFQLNWLSFGGGTPPPATATATRTSTSSGATATRTATRTSTPSGPTPTSGGGCASATQIEAESFSAGLSSGVAPMGGGDGSADLGQIDGGDWAAYPNVNFGSGAGCIDYRIASPSGGGTVEARLDSASGALVGVACALPATGGWTTYATKQCALSGASGVHTLYLKFGGGSQTFQINWLKVYASGVTPSATRTSTGLAPSSTATRTSTPIGPTATRTNTSTGPTATATRTSTPSGPTATVGPPPPDGRKLIGYFQQWGVYAAGYFPKDIDAAKLNVINYAFGNVSTANTCYIETRAGWGDGWADFQRAYTAAESVDGVADTWDQKLKGNFNQLKKLKARHPGLKVVISLGGWTWSGRFSDAALPQNRAAFVKSCIDLYIRGDLPILPGDANAGGPGAALGVFDGIDVDWEYPAVAAYGGNPSLGIPPNVYRPEDTVNFTELLKEFRRQLDQVGAEHGKYYTLTIAAPAGPSKYSKIQVAAITPYLDWINLMTYDFHGDWDPITGHLAPMAPQSNDPTTNPEIKHEFNVSSAVQAYLGMGVPRSKLIVGVPFYGRGVKGVAPGPRGDGLYQPHGGAAHGTWDNPTYGDSGLFDASDVKQRFEPVSRLFWDSEAQVPYLHAPDGTWISYENTRSIGVKASYIVANNLGGGMIWELGGDRDRALITTLYNALR